MNIIKGSAVYPEGEGIKIIAHVCNNKGGWGKGFVLALSQRFGRMSESPEMRYRTWYQLGNTKNPDGSSLKFELGNTQFVSVSPDIIVANMIAQNGYSTPTYKAMCLNSLAKCLKTVNAEAIRLNASIHGPRFGCSLGGRTWDEVEPIIQEEVTVPITIYDFS